MDWEPSNGALLASTRSQLRIRRDELEPLVTEYERLVHLCEAFGELPDVPDGFSDAPDDSPARRHADLLRQQHEERARLQDWATELEPLVHEYDQLLHVLAAFDSAESLRPDLGTARRKARRRSPHRTDTRTADGQARLETLRGLLSEGRTRADLAAAMGVSQSRITELLVPLASAGEVRETPDPKHPSRKVWRLVAPAESDGGDGDGAA
jgi:hypothetical protein